MAHPICVGHKSGTAVVRPDLHSALALAQRRFFSHHAVLRPLARTCVFRNSRPSMRHSAASARRLVFCLSSRVIGIMLACADYPNDRFPDPQQPVGLLRSNGMEAPTRPRHRCAKVEVSPTT
jgi:hypothetical protein